MDGQTESALEPRGFGGWSRAVRVLFLSSWIKSEFEKSSTL